MAIQDFHQRTLSSSSTSTARIVCFIAAGLVIIAGIPPVLIGAVAATTGNLDGLLVGNLSLRFEMNVLMVEVVMLGSVRVTD